ncbi:MAG: MGMT family protein [Anaerolineae bacterium]
MYEEMDPKFNERVWALVRHIPAGKVLSYGRVAQLLGVPQGARAVGWAMHAVGTVPAAKDVPWHRVVNKWERLASRFPEKPLMNNGLLEAEGVRFDLSAELKIAGSAPYSGNHPLLRLSTYSTILRINATSVRNFPADTG